jgi:hypothetical protein
MIPLVKSDKDALLQKLEIPHTEFADQLHIHDNSVFCTDGFLHFGVGFQATRLSNLTDKQEGEYWRYWTGMRIHPLFDLGMKHSRFDRLTNPDFSGTRDATYAFTIDPDGKLFLFLAWKGRLRIWSGKVPKIKKEMDLSSKLQWDTGKDRKDIADDPKPFRVVETDIKGRFFFAYQDKSNRYFVTDTGRVLLLPRQGMAKRTECIWEDLRRPVRLLVEDNATGKTWAFAPRKDRSDKKLPDVYFPLAKKIEPVEYDSTKLPAWDLGKPLAMALAHARFLVKEKKVNLDEKKPKPADKK